MKKIGPSLIGERFGKLTVVEFKYIDKHHHSCWLCQCDCGNQVVVSRDRLVSGNTSSCGCIKLIPRYNDIIGERYGRLTVIGFDHIDERHQAYWVCQCDCGSKVVVKAASLKSGNTSSCGCYKRDRTRETMATHGLSTTRLYKAWQAMQNRCENSNYGSYHRYGQRGIRVCGEWKNFENFRDWAVASGYSEGLSLDRINNDGNYCPENCRWTDWGTQCNNRSSNHIIEYGGQSHTVAEWARLFNMPYSTLQRHIQTNDMRDFIKYFNY